MADIDGKEHNKQSPKKENKRKRVALETTKPKKQCSEEQIILESENNKQEESLQPCKAHKSRRLNGKQKRLFYSKLKDKDGKELDVGDEFTLPGKVKATLVHKHCPLKQTPNVFQVGTFMQETELQYLSKFITCNCKRFQLSYVDDDSQENMVEIQHRKSQFLSWPTSKSNIARKVASRAAKLVYSDWQTVETPQLLTYIGDGDSGDYFHEHHDVADDYERDGDEVKAFEFESSSQTAGFYRLFTIFVYLNTPPVKDGEGGTHFPVLNVTGHPVKGSAMIWPNIRPDGSVEPSVVHEAIPVKSAGVQKFGMNLWVTSLDMSDQQDVTCGVKYNMKEPKNLKFDETQMLWQKRFEQGTV
eukprot:m.87183 g.87183  ORF g.87183 m.87183 type:complete len:358 (+) comp13094_c0_seq3:30-1103(+)